MARFTVLLLTLCSAVFAQTSGFGPGVSYPAQNMPIATVTADLNGDGKPDLAVANAASSTVSIYFGKGDGSFTMGPTIAIPGGCAVTGLATGDFTGDGKADIFAACSFQSQVWVLPGAGAAQFGTPISTNLNDEVLFEGFIATELTNIAVADYNGDGKLDFAAVTVPSSSSLLVASIQIFVGNGNGAFAPSSTLSFPQSVIPNVLLTADFNQDGIPDLAVAATDTGKDSDLSQIFLFRGAGSGNFQQLAPISLSGDVVAGAMTIADVNGAANPI